MTDEMVSPPESSTGPVRRSGGRHRATRRTERAERRAARRTGTETAGGVAPVERARRPGRLPRPGRLFTAVLVVLVLAAAGGVAWLTVQVRAQDGVDAASSAAVAAGRTAAADILSYDYRSIDADIAKAKSESTGAFLTQYTQASSRLAQEAGPVKAIVQASVAGSSIVSATDDRVVLLLFVDQASIKQTGTGKDAKPQTRIDQARVRMTLSHVGDRWLVSELDAL